MSATIDRHTASYRQGLVLGLTMAELMLLLVFCLLIAVGVSLASQRAKLDDTMARMRQLESTAASEQAQLDTIRRNSRLAEVLDRQKGSASQHEIDAFWRKLVESSDTVARMQKEGIPINTLEQDTDSAAKLRQLMRDGIDPERLVRGAALASAIDAAAAEHNIANLTPDEIVALIEKAAAPAAGDQHSGHNWPPIINLSEADGYFFATGSAELTPSFAAELRTAVVGRLLQISDAFDVDVIEVVGHTDEQPVSGRASNLDRRMPAVAAGESGAGTLQWADNAGLGLARALSVVELLAGDARLRRFRILPLSAAQLIGIDGRLTRFDGQGDVRERRRIEIRMRKSS